ncbi:MAG: helix-turn-helix domain-containing protein [Firmicutes bacterium]|nr:helix-turn-helix domain-containing protein [Candidatus Colimorpha enterica]
MIDRQIDFGEKNDFPIIIRSMCQSRADNIDNARRAIHEAVEIKLFCEGTSTLLISDRLVKVKAGDIVLINPYETHATIDPGETDTGRYHIFMISLDFFNTSELDLRNFFFKHRKSFRTLITDGEKISGLLKDAVTEYENKEEGFRTALKGDLLLAFTYLIREHISEVSHIIREDEMHIYAVVEPALRRIRDGYADDLTVDELARLCCISKEYFCRVFRRFTGKSTMEYLRSYRLQIADIALKTTDRSISDIAISCGFRDPNYFSRVYRKTYGCPPKAGRRRGIEDT